MVAPLSLLVSILFAGLLSGCSGGSGGSNNGGGTKTRPTPDVPAPSADETRLADLIAHDAGQHRVTMRYNAFLAKAAYDHAKDMANRHFFDHVNPDGHGSNWRVLATGYVLPSGYSHDPTINEVESLGVRQTTPEEMLNDWKNSPGHKAHVLGEDAFFAGQINYGISHYHDPNSDYKDYWVFVAAAPEP